jgi:hypothetical protein
MLYAGSRGPTIGSAQFGYLAPMWREIRTLKQRDTQYADKEILHDVLGRVSAPNTPFKSLLLYAQDVERQLELLRRTRNADTDTDGNVLWRALSGIFAANAEGAVSICIGRDVTRQKVFASTELPVLLRNAKIDSDTRDILHYYARCVAAGQTDIGVSIIRA